MVYKAELKWCIKCNKNIKIITNKRNYINHTNNNQNRKKIGIQILLCTPITLYGIMLNQICIMRI